MENGGGVLTTLLQQTSNSHGQSPGDKLMHCSGHLLQPLTLWACLFAPDTLNLVPVSQQEHARF